MSAICCHRYDPGAILDIIVQSRCKQCVHHIITSDVIAVRGDQSHSHKALTYHTGMHLPAPPDISEPSLRVLTHQLFMSLMLPFHSQSVTSNLRYQVHVRLASALPMSPHFDGALPGLIAISLLRSSSLAHALPAVMPHHDLSGSIQHVSSTIPIRFCGSSNFSPNPPHGVEDLECSLLVPDQDTQYQSGRLYPMSSMGLQPAHPVAAFQYLQCF